METESYLVSMTQANILMFFTIHIIIGEAEVQKYMFTYHTEGQFHFMFILYL